MKKIVSFLVLSVTYLAYPAPVDAAVITVHTGGQVCQRSYYIDDIYDGTGWVTADVVWTSDWVCFNEAEVGPISDPVVGVGGGLAGPSVPAVCLELYSRGLPAGCDRELAGAGTPTPDLDNPNQLKYLMNTLLPSDLVNAREIAARYELSLCYADVSIPTSACEDVYLSAISNLYSGFDLNTTQRMYLHQAIENITTRLANTAANRALAGWLFSSDPSFSFYNIGLSSAFWAGFLQYTPFDRALRAAREQRRCNLWYQVWDQNGCSEAG